ncbi:NAD(P)-dependent alcohol dehydrogenase [Rhodococcus sp. T2V]|uniref:NAD(P)-dependent alcohol dehydrogenase n=1 Tax=Rhodococcus sp. T2V TaxID=3034164 RepID=UPI0023E2A3B5|nr:NAD(P)-dependent alcohol dehydrogenase [Rhodococcus sp. T2V]MDF3312140.1 NAD(P)-dependent alcohol dehydrogenase [Rhodococcus sp. T2V]
MSTTTRTQAAISRDAAGPLVIEAVDIDGPRADEVLVRLVATGVCHTDVVSRYAPPEGSGAVFGHEGAGIVEQVGEKVVDVQVGDAVLMSFASCGECDLCASGHPGYCAHFGALNAGGCRLDGSAPLSHDGQPLYSSFFGQSSFARHAVVAARSVVVVPPDTDLVASAAMGCGFQTGAGAVANVMRPATDDSLVVFGVGGVGAAAIMAARALGLTNIVAVDLSKERRETALRLGAASVVDGAEPDVVGRVKDLTGGGATFGLDTTAVPAVIRNAALALAPLGTLVVVGVGAPEVTIDVMDLIGQGKSIRGSIEGDAVPRELIATMLSWQAAGRFPAGSVVTSFPFEKINDALAATGPVVKPVITFE